MRQDTESVLGNSCNLDIFGSNLLLHDALEHFGSQLCCLSETERLVKVLGKLGLGAFGASADGFGVVARQRT